MKKTVSSITLSFMLACSVAAQPGYLPSEEILKARNEFQDEKFGIMICWGIYSMMGDGEWVMNDRALDWKDYAKLAEGFIPQNLMLRHGSAPSSPVGPDTSTSCHVTTTASRCSSLRFQISTS